MPVMLFVRFSQPKGQKPITRPLSSTGKETKQENTEKCILPLVKLNRDLHPGRLTRLFLRLILEKSAFRYAMIFIILTAGKNLQKRELKSFSGHRHLPP